MVTTSQLQKVILTCNQVVCMVTTSQLQNCGTTQWCCSDVPNRLTLTVKPNLRICSFILRDFNNSFFLLVQATLGCIKSNTDFT